MAGVPGRRFLPVAPGEGGERGLSPLPGVGQGARPPGGTPVSLRGWLGQRAIGDIVTVGVARAPRRLQRGNAPCLGPRLPSWHSRRSRGKDHPVGSARPTAHVELREDELLDQPGVYRGHRRAVANWSARGRSALKFCAGCPATPTVTIFADGPLAEPAPQADCVPPGGRAPCRPPAKGGRTPFTPLPRERAKTARPWTPAMGCLGCCRATLAGRADGHAEFLGPVVDLAQLAPCPLLQPTEVA